MSFIEFRKKLVVIIALVVCPAISSAEYYSDWRRLHKPSVKLISIGAQKATKAIEASPFDQNSVWDQEIFKNDPELKKLIEKFLAGTAGKSVKDLNLSGKSIQEIEKILIKNGFCIDQNYEQSKYRKRWQKIYKHTDGGIVRLKIKGNSIRPQPQVIKAVLRDSKGECSWDNEAFKVSDNGKPLPKCPKSKCGIKLHSPSSKGKDEDAGWIDLIMEEAHPDVVETAANN